MAMEGYQEPSVLEYTRFHGLTSNYLAYRPLDAVHELRCNLPSDIVASEDGLFEITPEHEKIPVERLAITRDAIALLSQVTRVTANYKVPLEDFIPNPPFYDGMKVELPLLRTDHETDVLGFVGHASAGFAKLGVPMEILNEERDEDSEFPDEYHDFREKMEERIRAEKLVTSKRDFLWMQNALAWPPSQQGTPLEGFQMTKPIWPVSTSATPIFMPATPEAVQFIPSLDLCNLELLPETSSPIRKEADEMSREIMAKDSIVSGTRQLPILDKIGSIYSPLKDIEKVPPLSGKFSRYGEANKMKLTSPMTPPRSHSRDKTHRPITKKTPPYFHTRLPSPLPVPETTTSEDIDNIFDERAKTLADGIVQRISNERLTEADARMRIKVPVMDFSKPKPPWDSKREDNRKLLKELQNEHLQGCEQSVDAKAERALRWVPFPAGLAKLRSDDAIDETDYLQEICKPPPLVDPSLSLEINKSLLLLAEADSEHDEIGAADWEAQAGFRVLLKKRKIDMSKEEHASTIDFRTSTVENEKIDNNEVSTASFSAFASLNSFIALRARPSKRRKVEMFETAPHLERRTHSIKIQKATPALPHLTEEANFIAPPEIRKLTSAAPALPSNLPPASFLISASLFSSRSLLHSIQSLYPSARLIERDFNLYQRSDANFSISSAGDEADIILSPSTGLIVTTLQKISQRSLPVKGQTQRNPLSGRIALVARRYSTLIILVSQGQGHSSGSSNLGLALGSSDCLALTDFTASCRVIEDADVQTLFCSGGEEELATWAVDVMVRYRMTDSTTDLLDEETPWEIWLRQAGLNACAAQFVIATLNNLNLPTLGTFTPAIQLVIPTKSRFFAASKTNYVDLEVHGRETPDFASKLAPPRMLSGLTTFLAMSLEQRLEKFGTSLGFRFVQRISAILDVQWTS